MRFALDVAPLGDLADPAGLVRLGRVLEAAGWDGLSIWDSLGVSSDTVAPDPFVVLAGVAATTRRLALITSVVALSRRRPQLVAQSASTLDRLSGGRLVLGVGAGGDERDFTAFGDPWETRGRIARMDESATIVDRLLRGEVVSHRGDAFTVDGVALCPPPVRRPRPPMWMGAFRRAGIVRAARWDGWIAVTVGDDGVSMAMPPDTLAGWMTLVREERERAGLADTPFDLAVFGHAGLGGFAPADYEAVGATWWLENVSPMRGSIDDITRLAEAGPPGTP